MPHSIKDIEKWKEEYPLLKDIWIKYDNFDKDVKNDTNISKYISVCSYFIKPWDEGKEEDKEFCTKLVRNLGHHSDNKDFLNYKTHDCLNLNNWIYNSMMKNNIQENIIKECFKEYDAVKDKIPSLEYEKHANLLGCETGESLRGRPHSQTYQKQIHDQTYPEQKPVETFPPPQIDENNDSSNPISPTVSTALGTVAGASSLLALLYKFSPGRNWIRSGFSGGTGRIRSNLYADQPNELFYDGFEGEVMSSYNPTYNVGYGSA
ncbi:unnamed protein product [Plasmodium vivax]|uniref:(malaria parasite P. vivax) hypothetical protein n=1 Tax=Plasmodium vivax TaxID=5855 RepID=A0A8S4HBW8_PLAVI|nr:unnamed protein product [Plasmodium vivax]